MKGKYTWRTGTDEGDRRLSGLTPAQTQRVRDLARAVLAARGLEATVHADSLRLIDGRTFGLGNLASVCHNVGEDAWPQVVEDHLGAILDRYPAVPPELTAPQILAGAHLRLVPAEALADLGEDTRKECYRYAREIGGGFLELVAHAEDGFVRWLRDCEVDLVGAAALRDLGRERVRRIRPDVCEEWRRADGRIYSLRGESGFLASKLLVLEDALDRALPRGRREVPHGVLVAVPTRHELILTPVDASVLENLTGLMALVPRLHLEGRAPLSPHVYWWSAGRVEALTRYDALGHYGVAGPEGFMDVVGELFPDFGAA
ncbi:MAG: hypothetical protein ACT4QF_12235 [Sporichthyaceae bacterium]